MVLRPDPDNAPTAGSLFNACVGEMLAGRIATAFYWVKAVWKVLGDGSGLRQTIWGNCVHSSFAQSTKRSELTFRALLSSDGTREVHFEPTNAS